jgi:hypothetical protein
MNGTLRFLVVVAVTAVALWLLWTPYRDAIHQIDHQLHNNGGAQAADDLPRPHRRTNCTGSIWSNHLGCGPALREDGRR